MLRISDNLQPSATRLEQLFNDLADGIEGLSSTQNTIPQIPTHDKQEMFIMSDAYYSAMVGGIGSGKSIAGCIKALYAAYGRVGSKQIKTPNLGVITAPTYRMLKDATFRTFMDYASDYVEDYNRSDFKVTLKNGSEVLFRSTTEPETLRGPSISWWFADEAAMYQPLVWKIMIGRLRQFGKRGYGWLSTTPRGRNWLWQVFIRDGNEDMFLIQVHTRDNTFQDEDIVTDWERLYVGDFAKQELGGEFVAFEGLIYPEFSREKHVRYQLPDKPFKYAVAGVDWGFANPGVIEVAGVDTDDNMMLVEEAYSPGRRIGEWVEVAKQMRDRWDIKRFYCDPSEPDYINAFNEAGLKAEGANNSVNPGIQAVKARLAGIKPQLTVFAGVAHYPDECEQYIWATNQHGIKDVPVKAKDHTQDAVRYLVMGVDYNDDENITISSGNYVGYNKHKQPRKLYGINRGRDKS
jgi:PBSX family phage terminase large subunit